MPIQTHKCTEIVTRVMPLWKVLLHNDDIHTYDDVTRALILIFKFEQQKAEELTYEVDSTGCALCQVEPKEVAELHRDQLQSFGLTSTIEPE